MEYISSDLINTIRQYINDSYFQNKLVSTERHNWYKVTSALDSIEDASSIISYYVEEEFPDKDGGDYLFLYGLLQGLYVTQDCVNSIMQALFNEKVDFYNRYSDLSFVRNIRDDIQHATNRKGSEWIYLTHWTLSKGYFEYYKQSVESFSLIPKKINVFDMIDKNNAGINEILEEIVIKCQEELTMYKEKYKKEKICDIFTTITYDLSKVGDKDSYLYGNLTVLNNTITQYESVLIDRYIDIENCQGDCCIINKAKNIMKAIEDHIILDIKDLDKRAVIEESLYDSLRSCFHQLIVNAKEHDQYFESKVPEA